MAHGVKSGIGEIQTEQLLPIEPPTHRLCRLLIRQVLHTWHHGDQGQSPWSLGGLPIRRKEVRKIFIGVDASQDIAHVHVHVAFRVRRACDSGGFR